MLDVRHLALVRALADHGSMSAVARALGYSQPAVSHQVRSLEAALGTALVTRERQGVHLTEAGQVILRHSEAVMDALSLAEAEISAIAGLRGGRVRVAAFPSAAATIVAATMGEMTRNHPGVAFTLTEAEPPDALELLASGECDIAVVFRYSTEEAFDEERFVWSDLLVEQVRVALPATHPATAADEVTLADLWDSRWIAGCPRCRGHLTRLCQKAGFVPDIAFETSDYVALQNLAVRGLGVALLPDLYAAAVHVEGLQIRPVRPASTRTVSAVSTIGLSRVPGVRQTLETLREMGAAMGQTIREVPPERGGIDNIQNEDQDA